MAVTLIVRIETKNPDLSKVLAKIMHSIEGFTVKLSHADEGIELLIYDIGQDVEHDVEHIQFLMGRNKKARLFLTSQNSDPSVLMQAIRIGAKEFFSQPIDSDELREAFLRLNITTSRRLGEVCTVMGCKGGVGATSVAVNLAVALKGLRHDASVALVDMNLSFGDIPLFLNFKPKYTWVEIAKHINRVDDVFLNDNLFEHASGIQVLPSPGMLQGADGVTPAVFMRILAHMRRLFDFIVIDIGHSFSDMNRKTLEISNHVFVVSLLSLPCLSNTGKLLASFEAWGYPSRQNTHVIINRHIPHSEISIQECEKSINKKVFWKLPNDYALTMSAINQGIPLCDVDGKAAVTKSFSGFAQKLMPADAQDSAGAGISFKKMPILKSLFRGSQQ